MSCGYFLFQGRTGRGMMAEDSYTPGKGRYRAWRWKRGYFGHIGQDVYVARFL